MYQQEPARVGVGIGAFGVAFTFLTTALLVLVPQELLGPAARATYVETWSRPIMAIGEGVMVYGLLVVSAGFAYYLTTKNHAPESVLTGFVLGGLVLVLGVALLAVTVTHLFAADPAIDRSFVSHVSRNLVLGARLVGGALLGVLSATVVEERF